MRTSYVVDRIEGDYAVLQDGDCRALDVPLAELPAGISEGARVSGGTGLPWQLEPAADAALDEAQARLERLKARTPQSGDIEL